VTTIEDNPPGLPVELGKIDRELGLLWEESGDTKTRASLINLAIYTESPEAVEANTALISQVAREYACRAILIFANRAAARNEARAWISAHCHMAGKGDRQVCSEQITFQLDGDLVGSLPNIVFSHLDSDLPLCFWWQGAFPDADDATLWTWVDRLIFDSQDWSDPAVQFERVRALHASEGRVVLCDLNWTRLLRTRFALAQFFDHAGALPHLSRIRRVEIVHAPGCRTVGLLILGWLAAQLGWTHQEILGRHTFRSAAGAEVQFALTASPGASLGACRLFSDTASFELARSENGEVFRAAMTLPECGEIHSTLSAGRDQLVDVLVTELSRGGKHPLYLKSLESVAPLFLS